VKDLFSGRSGAIIAAVAVAGWFAAGLYYFGIAPESVQNSQMPVAETAGTAAIGGPFSLIDQDGKRVTEQDFAGKYLLVYFGYAYCPDICPATLYTMTEALDQLGDKAKAVQPILITVDPERDTPEILKQYVGNFHPDLVGLTGSPAEVSAAAKAYRVYFAKVVVDDGDPDNYLVDHSAFVFLIAPNGGYITHFSSSTTPAEMAERLAELL
jgi:protein SCO1